MKIAIAQTDPIVGDFEGNVKKILKNYERALKDGARLLLTPELSLFGYPPHDLIDRPEIFERNQKALEQIARATTAKKTAIVVGHVAQNKASHGRPAQNCISLIEDGKLQWTQAKQLLPTYDVFDEARYFEPGTEIFLHEIDGVKTAFAICEDLWAEDERFGRRLYGKNPVDQIIQLNPELLISISASPYEYQKASKRLEIHQKISKTLAAPVVYVNCVGATDEILFDGASFVLDQTGKSVGHLKSFATDFALIDVEKNILKKTEFWMPEPTNADESLADGLVVGIREYFGRTGFKKAVLGLSGGIDSAVVACLAAKALGPENVHGVAMPSQYSSGHALEDADLLAKNLQIAFEVTPIKFLFSTANREWSGKRGGFSELAQENLQSRLRANILMTFSNHSGALVLTTGNKSELATGYCTLYGDMCGAIAPIGDLYKTEVYKLAHWINKNWNAPIPERSITKPPSAELKPNQVDQDTLPDYGDLDAFLSGYIEGGESVESLKGRLKFKWIESIADKIEKNEYKRRQAAPVLKVSSKAFGVGRRIPIAKHWDSLTQT